MSQATDLRYWKRMAEIGNNNSDFYLMEIGRITVLYNQLLDRYVALEAKYKTLLEELKL